MGGGTPGSCALSSMYGVLEMSVVRERRGVGGIMCLYWGGVRGERGER